MKTRRLLADCQQFEQLRCVADQVPASMDVQAETESSMAELQVAFELFDRDDVSLMLPQLW